MAGACPASLSTTTTTIKCDPYPANQVESAWVEIGSGNVAVARALTAAVAADGGANPCPNITLNGGAPQQMNLRAAATMSLPLRTTVVTPNKPSFFPVSSCELTLPAGTTSAVVAGQSLPLPKANPQKVVVLGDTGCRLEVGNGWQSCNDPAQYPFATIAALAAAHQPDLVLHVGDYQYRESECPAGMGLSCAGSPWGYGWDTWQADFFGPGAPLLAAAPWVMVRGNHESCNRAGQGWFRFLDTNAYDPVTKNCNSAANDTSAAGGNYNDPYLVSINSSTQLVIFDSSNIPKTVPATNSVAYTTYQSEIQAAGALVATPPAGVTFNWWSNHHPILGFATATPPAVPTTAAPGFAPIMNSVFPNTYFPPNVNLALHGHVHDFQAIDFLPGSGYSNAATLVSGNAGDLLDIALPGTLASPGPGVSVASEGDGGTGERDGQLGRLRIHGARVPARQRNLARDRVPRRQLRARHLRRAADRPDDLRLVRVPAVIGDRRRRSSWTAAAFVLGFVALAACRDGSKGDPAPRTSDPSGPTILASVAARPAAALPAVDFTPPRKAPEPTARERLGKAIFFDASLSNPAGTSCASCHDPRRAFSGNNGSHTGVAAGSRAGHFARRNTPSVLYMKYVPAFHFALEDDDDPAVSPFGGVGWSGRADSVAEFSRLPLLDADEMNGGGEAALAVKARNAPYAAELAREFPGALDHPGTAVGAIGDALQAYLTSDAMAPFSSRSRTTTCAAASS